jgi:hypothetical protein
MNPTGYGESLAILRASVRGRSLKKAWRWSPLISMTWSLLKRLSRYCGHKFPHSLITVKSELTITQNAEIIFAFTNFFEAFATSGPEVATQVEYARGVNLAKAASATISLQHYIWSTLPNRSAISKGKWEVPHCDAKAQVDMFIKKNEVLLAKTTFLWEGFFAETIHHPMFVPNLLVSARILTNTRC